MKKPRWEKSEFIQVIAEFDRLQKINRRHMRLAMPEAQLVLSPERRRDKFSAVLCAKLNRIYQQWINDGHPGNGTASDPGLNPDTTEVIVLEKKVIIKEQPDFGRIPTVTLARVLCERLANYEETIALLTGLQDRLLAKREEEARYDSRLDTRPPEKIKPSGKPVHICVLGIRPEFIAELKEKSANLPRPVELSFRTGSDFTKEPDKAAQYLLVTGDHAGKWRMKAKAAGDDGCVIESAGDVISLLKTLYDVTSRQSAA